jgi:hypothetical protein
MVSKLFMVSPSALTSSNKWYLILCYHSFIQNLSAHSAKSRGTPVENHWIDLVKQLYFKTKIIQSTVHVIYVFPLGAKRDAQHIIVRNVRRCRPRGLVTCKLRCFANQLKREHILLLVRNESSRHVYCAVVCWSRLCCGAVSTFRFLSLKYVK